MNRSEYLDRLAERLSRMGLDKGYENQREQVRSKELLSHLSPDELGQIGYTYSRERLTRNSLLVFEGASRLLEDGRELAPFSNLFRTAAEIFEHLQGLGEGPEQLQSGLLAAALYQVAGYQANAACIARALPVPELPTESSPFSFSTMLSRWANLAIQARFVRVLSETSRIRVAMPEIEARLLSQTEEQNLHSDSILAVTELSLIVDAFAALASFALRGEETQFQSLLRSCEDAFDLLGRTGQADDLLLLRVIYTFSQQLRRDSTWRLLAEFINRDPMWRRYAMLLARGTAPNQLDARGVVQLWPSQQIAIRTGLLLDNRGYVIRMPTSAGKTRIAELMAMAVLDSPEASRRVLYVAPFRALSDEVEGALGQIFSDLGLRVSSLLGSFELDAFQDYLLQETDLLITTPEKLNLLSRARPEFFRNVDLIILDEGHVIEDYDRGAKYELLLTRIRALMPQDSRVLFISAVIPESNAKEFARWLCDDPSSVISTDWRPARQALGLFRWIGDAGRIDYPLEEPVVRSQPPFIPRVIRSQEYTDYTPKLLKPKLTTFPSKQKGDTAAELAIRFAELGPVLIFTTKPDWVESCAKAVQRGLTLRRQTAGAGVSQVFQDARDRAAFTSSVEIANDWLGSESLVSKLLSDGIAVHHRGLPESLRRAVEEDFRRGNFPVLVATNTLGQGVNLPIKTVVVHSIARYHQAEAPEEEGYPDPLKQREFWNVCGRAGRAGAETEGQIIFIALKPEDVQQFETYASKEYEPIHGRLFEILIDLASNRLSREEFARELDSEILSLLAEEAVGTDSVERIERILKSSFVSVQAESHGRSIQPLVAMGVATAGDLVERIGSSATRKAFSLTGLRVTSCEALVNTVTQSDGHIRELLTNPEAPLNELLLMAYDAVESLPQMEPQYSFETDYITLLSDWVNQTPVERLVGEYCSSPAEAQRLHRFIEDYFGFRLPWGIGGFLRIAKHHLGLPERLSDLQEYLPSMVKFGVNHPYATWPMSIGCPSRQLAATIAQAFAAENPETATFRRFFDWFGLLTEEDFVYRFGATSNQARILSGRARIIVPDRTQFVDLVRGNPDPVTGSLVGTQYGGRETYALGLRVGETVALERDYVNFYDRNAVGILFRGNQIGYLDRRTARLVAPNLDSGSRYHATIASLEMQPRLRAGIHVSRA